MTKEDREKFKKREGYDPCFQAWGSDGVSHLCRRKRGHDGKCRCGTCHAERPEDHR
jgi:N6-adenosine-specific RNA methylase IME4